MTAPAAATPSSARSSRGTSSFHNRLSATSSERPFQDATHVRPVRFRPLRRPASGQRLGETPRRHQAYHGCLGQGSRPLGPAGSYHLVPRGAFRVTARRLPEEFFSAQRGYVPDILIRLMDTSARPPRHVDRLFDVKTLHVRQNPEADVAYTNNINVEQRALAVHTLIERQIRQADHDYLGTPTCPSSAHSWMARSRGELLRQSFRSGLRCGWGSLFRRGATRRCHLHGRCHHPCAAQGSRPRAQAPAETIAAIGSASPWRIFVARRSCFKPHRAPHPPELSAQRAP
ncbi:hypothetical protein RI054_02g09630 [Pseudoscourfieldia marina]